MEFRILGPFEVYEEGQALSVAGKPRALLALLLLEHGKALGRERLIDELWGDAPPETASKAIQVFATRLRKALPGLPLATHGTAYVLEVGRDQIDRDRFEDLVAEARRAAADTPERSAEMLREALDLWRGTPLAEISEPFARAAAAALEEQRLAAVEDRIEIELALGQHRQLVHELELLAASHPFRERLRGQLMLALYRSGRQADSLQTYADARRVLVGELGLEPSRELNELQRRVLAHDPSLDVEAKPSTDARIAAQRRPRRLPVAVGAVVVVAVVSIVAASLLFGGGVTSVVLASRSVTRLDAVTGKATSQVSLGATPLFVATDTSGAWAATAEGTVVHIGNPSHPRADMTASVDFRPSDLAVEDGDPWVADSAAASVARVSPRYERVVAQVPLPHPSERAQPVGDIAPRLAAGDGSVWVAEGQTTVIRIDPRTNTIGRRIRPRTGASGAIAYGAGAVWVGGGNSVAEISPASGVVVSTIRLDATPAAITVAAGSLWIALGHTATIVRIDPYTDAPIASIDAGGRPLAIAALRGTVWVLTRNELVHIDAATNAITRRIKLRGDPLALAATDTTLWVAAG